MRVLNNVESVNKVELRQPAGFASGLRRGTEKALTGNRMGDWLPTLLLLALWLLGLGCRSAEKTGESNFAWVVISGNTRGQIADAAMEVFGEHGYKSTQIDPTRLIFEKVGTKMNNFAYGSWMGDTPIWIRVKTTIVPAGEMTYRLQCNAYLVRDRGSAAEEEVTINHLHKGTYQKLLNEVAERFRRK